MIKKRIVTVIVSTTATTILSLVGGVSAFAATGPIASPGVSPGYINPGGGGYNSQYSGYAPVGVPTTLKDTFGVTWQNDTGLMSATATFPWNVTVYAESKSDLEWMNSYLGGGGTYSGPADGVFGYTYYQTSAGSSNDSVAVFGDPINGPQVMEDLPPLVDSGSWVPGAWQEAEQEVYAYYPYDWFTGYAN